MLLLIVLRLIIVHNVEGREVHINPDHIVTMREAREGEQRMVTDEARCVITLLDGKYQTVTEACAVVRNMIHGDRP